MSNTESGEGSQSGGHRSSIFSSETKDDRYRMPAGQSTVDGTCHDFTEVDQYGTFGGGAKPFLAFAELEVLIGLELARFMKFCILATAIGLLVPLTPIVLLVLSPCLCRHWSGPVRDFVSGVCLCFVVFLFFFTAPIVVWSVKGWEYMLELYRTRTVVSQVEMFSVVVCYFLMLYFLAYIWVVSHDVTTMFQDETKRRRIFVKQYNALAQEYLLKLEKLPGWAHQTTDEENDDTSSATARSLESADTEDDESIAAGPSARSGLMAKDKKLKQAQKLSGVSGMAKFFHHLKHWWFHNHRVRQRHSDIYMNAEHKTVWQGSHGVPFKLSLGLIFVALLRAMIPRLWVCLFHREALLPIHEPLLCWMIIHSFFINWVTASLWLVLLNNVRVSYGHNMVQMMLISALVSKKATVSYKSHIETMYQIPITKAEIPHMNLSNSEVMKAWWMVREYALVDMMEERVPLEIVLVLSMSYIFVVLVYTIVDFFLRTTGFVGAFTIQSLFDTLVISYLAITALASCVTINEIQGEHTGELVKCRHSLLFLHSGKTDLGSGDIFSCRLLDHLANRVMYHDHRQRILGSEIDSGTMATIYIETAVAVVSNIAILYRYM